MIEIGKINQIIAEFCGEVVTEPLCFFSEADLQGLLFAKLLKEFPDNIETSFARGPSSKGKYMTGLVHREYGVGYKQTMDIVIFSPEDVSRINSANLQIGNTYLKPVYGVELGTEKTLNTEQHLKNDISKLSEVSERGYLIHLFRDVTSADMGTKSRNNTEAKIEKIFRSPFESRDFPPKVKILCFLLRLARRHKKIWGKCEMFIPEIKQWEKVNVKKAKEQVLSILEQ